MADADATQDAPHAILELQVESEQDAEDRLKKLRAQAMAQYAVKNYQAAAELYSRATELQAEIRGEMDPDNADLLFEYGRCLYHLAIQNNDVLGPKVAAESAELSTKKSTSDNKNGDSSATSKSDPVTEKVAATAVPDKEKSKAGGTGPAISKPFFQFTGDENFEEPDDDDEPDGDDDDEAPEDDLANAYEVLDLARILLQRRLDELMHEESQNNNGKGSKMSSKEKEVKELLSDTYDLQGEISLENAHFGACADDWRAALELRKEIFEPSSPYIGEMYYKYGLALERNSVKYDDPEDPACPPKIDHEMRLEARKQTQLAIDNCRLRLAEEEVNLAKEKDPKEAKEMVDEIAQCRKLIIDMEERLDEIDTLPVPTYDPTVDVIMAARGILGSMIGESSEAQQARLEAVAKEAKDVSNLVKRKKTAAPNTAGPSSTGGNSNGGPEKRKAEEQDMDKGANGGGKKAKVEDATEKE